MRITGNNLGKKFSRNRVFRNISFEIQENSSLVILGPNGSGKSTLLKIISAAMLPDEGSIFWYYKQREVPAEDVFRHVGIATPYMELIEDFTLKESIDFHSKFKAFPEGWNTARLIEYSGLTKSSDKLVRNFSSGMKQKLKLLLAVASHSSLVLLDEPCSHLDSGAIAWYQQLVEDFGQNKTFIVCSNHQSQEYSYCKNELKIPVG